MAISTDVLSPFEKTNVSLTCGASVYAFSRIHWYFTDSHNVTTSIKRKSKGYNLESNLTSFSKVSVLTLIDVDVNRTGMYICSATRRADNKNSTAEIPILVRSMYDWNDSCYLREYCTLDQFCKCLCIFSQKLQHMVASKYVSYR